ncbi:MAG TPA: serine hydrolase [Puia sp.]|nr:serine hydrolase [Puia sp.]
MLKSCLLAPTLALSLFLSGQQPSTPAAPTSPGPTPAIIARLQRDIPRLLDSSDVPGLSIAVIRNGKLAFVGAFGVTNADTKRPVTAQTVFEAASLSKPVFAYAVLKLVDEGRLNLDTPLTRYLGNDYDVVDDPRVRLITARMVLSHTSGFPNWRGMDGTKDLKIHFTPGTRWRYSGEGIVYLSRVVEKITGLRFETFMQQYALRPLGMFSSSYIWRSRYDTLKAYRHDLVGAVSGRNQPSDRKEDTTRDDANAAASLQTTAGDYARFVTVLLNGAGLKKTTWRQMMTPQPGTKVDSLYPQLAWGLGIGLEMTPEDPSSPGDEYFWHWGDNGDAKAFVMADLRTKDAVVYFADADNGLSFTREILDDAIGGNHPSVAHLDYDRYNSPGRLFTKTALTKNAAAALAQYREQRDAAGAIPEETLNNVGYMLMGKKRLDEAIEVFTQNTIDHPGSWNVWDSLAEACMNKGDKSHAIEYYQRSLGLNPGNTNGATQLKKLQQ